MAEPQRPPFYERDSLTVQTYDVRSDPAGTPVEGDVPFFTRAARESGGPVLELGTGTGRVAWPIAEAGVRVVGLDRSPVMLARAEAKRQSASPAARELARFVQGDMVDFALADRFRLAIVPFRAFMSLTDPAAQRACLECVRRHLEPNGRLIVDLFDPRLEYCLPDEHRSPTAREGVVNPQTGNRVEITIAERTNDPAAQTLREVWRFTERDARGRVVAEDEEVLQMRWTYRQEMRYLFELAGYSIVALFGDFLGGPPAYGREQVWVVTPHA